MKAVILCGGQGTRLREHTDKVPKPMIEIGGRPMLWHIMKTYAKHGITEFVLCLGYKGHLIKEYFINYQVRTSDVTVTLGDEPKVTIDRHVSESDWKISLVETGDDAMTGARVFRIRDHIAEPSFCLTYGDGLANVDIAASLAFHQQHGKMVTVTGVRPSARFGELELDGNRVVAFAEKPQVNESFINGGFLVIRREFIDTYLNDSEELTLEREPLRRAAADGEMMMFPHTGFWQCMDTYREWKLLDDMWESGRAEWKVW